MRFNTKNLKKNIVIKLMVLMIGCFIYYTNVWVTEVFAKDSAGNLVIVIDPGHGGPEGGSNFGASYDGYIEKNMNMQVADAMKEELETYEGVKVYLTHESTEVQMSLAERAEFAESVNADFLFSIHFNASEEHNLYGSEVWIPSIGSYYVAGMQFGTIELEALENLGLYGRGVKTRIGDDGDEYYGIIRECEWRNINAVIIEHCHLDNMNDREYMDASALEKFGKTDATSVAKYFGLKGSNGDYSGYKNIDVTAPGTRIAQDLSEPEVCNLSLIEVTGDGSFSFEIEAADNDSRINYYSYSLDGGNTFTDLMIWDDEDGDNKVAITVAGLKSEAANLVVRAYNKYDVYAESNQVEVTGIYEEETSKNNSGDIVDNSENNSSEEPEIEPKEEADRREKVENNKGKIVAIILVVGGIIITVLILQVKKMGNSGKKRKKNKRKSNKRR